MRNIVKKLALLLVLGTSTLNAMEATTCELPYLMLHVDINNTIIAEDKSKGLNPEESIAAILSDAPEYAYTWGNDGKEMTYYAWLNKQYPGSDPVIKQKRESYQAKFIAAAREHHHPMLKKINNEYASLVNSLETREPRKVFTSFSKERQKLFILNYFAHVWQGSCVGIRRTCSRWPHIYPWFI